MTRIVSAALGALLVLFLTALVAVWAALAMRTLSPADTLRVFAMLGFVLTAVLVAVATMLVMTIRVRRRRLDAFKEALRLRRPMAPGGEFGDLTLLANGLLEELARARRERRASDEIGDRDERLASLGRFAAGIAHEIRNPITNVIGFAALARERCEDESLLRDLAAIEEEARRCEAITDSVTAFSRVPAIRPEPLDPVTLLVAPPGLELAVEGDAAGTRIMGDRVLLRRVLENLLENARHAGARRVTVVIERVGADLRLRVRDDGRGIPAAIVERLFEPFATSRPGGLGLGLAIARGIVAAHGGTLVARNQPAGGAEFEVVLPVRRGSDV